MIRRTVNALGKVAEMAADRSVHAAFQWFHLHEMQIMQWQRDVTTIPAPPFAEATRAQWMRDRFVDLELTGAHMDDEGNVLATYPATANAGVLPECIVIAAHLDTVFCCRHSSHSCAAKRPNLRSRHQRQRMRSRRITCDRRLNALRRR